jgi:acyl transferase domain-containing protein
LDTAKIAYFGACKPWRSLTESRRENHENMDGKNNTLQQSWMEIFENDIRRQLNAQTINAFGLKESLFCCDRMLNKNGDEKISEESEDTLDNKEYHILTLSAKSENELLELSNKYVSYLEKHPTVSIQDLAFTANTVQSHLEKRACVIGTSVEELKQQIQNKKMICKSLSSKPKVAFLYTGHGSSYVGMARDLYAVNRVFRNAFNECLEILDKKYEISLREVVWNENYHHYMDFICYSHTAIFSVAYGLTKMWKSFGVEPEFISGHSAGESAAATAAGIFSLEHGISLVMNLATFIHKHLPDGAMMALRATEGKVSKLIASFLEGKTESEEHWLDISLINSPQQVIVSGPRNTVKMFNAYCTESGVKSQLVPGKDAFHSRAMEVIRKEYREFSGTLTFNPPRCSFVSARTGKVVDGVDPDYLVENMLKSVNYPAAAKTMASNGCNVYIEIGATPILLTLCMASTNLTEDVLWLPSIRRNENNWKTVLEAVGNLHTQGYPINWSAVEDNQEPRNKIDLPTQGTKSKNCFYTKK